MANKKFHYQDKKTDGAPRPGGRRGQNRPSGKQSGKNPAARRSEILETVSVRYSQEKLSLPLSALGVSEELVGLLSLNGISSAGDLVIRTEREMFKVQGFNKKMLLALKRGLEKEGMAFFEEAAASDAPRAEKTRQKEKPSSSRDREQKERKPLKERDEKPKKLTEPLPFPEWRKIQKNGKWGFYDGFKTVIPAMYDEVFFFKDGLAAVELDEKCGYINPENEVVIPMEYETAMSFSEGYASVVKGGKCGYIDKNNDIVIPFVYDAATPFEGGEAKVKKDGRWGTIFPDGSVKWI